MRNTLFFYGVLQSNCISLLILSDNDDDGKLKQDQMDVDDVDDNFTYSELESAASTLDDLDSITMIPPTPIDDQPPAPPPRYGSLVAGSGSRSTAVRTGRSWTAAHALRHTTSRTSASSATGGRSANVVNNMAYRHRSPDVIPSLSKKPR